MVKTQKVAVDVHALLESLGLCKLIGYDDSRRISSNFCFDFFTHCFYVIQYDFFLSDYNFGLYLSYSSVRHNPEPIILVFHCYSNLSLNAVICGSSISQRATNLRIW